MVKTILFIAIICFLVTLPQLTLGQGEQLSDLEFFIENELNEEIMEVKLESDWKLVRKEKSSEDPEYQPALMTFFLPENDSVEVSVRIKPRGLFRRNHCLFPPIWVNFVSEDFSNSSVEQYDKIKLVTHCRDSPSYKQQMIIEYYIYKIYEILTNYSFRTRMIKINYKDTVNKREPGWNYAFFIETLDQVAARNECSWFESQNMHPERLNRDLTTVMDVFQYMIGNTDWSIVVGHNVKLLKSLDPTEYFPIGLPYDFDYCGLVNASYAVPPEELDIVSVTDRVYRGFCRTDEEFQKVFDLFIENEEAILNLFQDSELLPFSLHMY